MSLARLDYPFPLMVGAGSRQAESPGYAQHVANMVRQLLLTTPGERVNRPDFGCGLRSMVFASPSGDVAASVELLVRQSLERWLSEHVNVTKVTVLDTSEPGLLDIRLDYELIETRVAEIVVLNVR